MSSPKKIVEFTGVPCSGKSFYIESLIVNRDIYRYVPITVCLKIKCFIGGIWVLELKKIIKLLSWSLKEDASLLFRLNIFLNAVSKFTQKNHIKSNLCNGESLFLIDEGVAHLPFLFLNTKTKEVIDLISEELKNIDVYIMSSPSIKTLSDRLKSRGHKRLNYLAESEFINRICDIENDILECYPDLCKSITIK